MGTALSLIGAIKASGTICGNEFESNSWFVTPLPMSLLSKSCQLNSHVSIIVFSWSWLLMNYGYICVEVTSADTSLAE